jgi:peptidoglycan/xylan/chitin deacetylase (PgdA/CDA1 family)
VPRAIAGFVLLLTLAGCGGAASGGGAATSATRAPARPALAHTIDRAHPSVADQRAAIAHYASVGLPLYCGGRHGRLVALTFDDGPGPYTRTALRILRRAGARATFFLVGASVKRYPKWPAREREIAAIGEHTMTHANLRSLSFHEAMAEVQTGRDAALAAAGPPVDLFRPPFGAHTEDLDREVGRNGMAEILWDVDSEDSRVSPPADFHAISATVRRAIRPGSIVLMHENRGQTIRALRAILPALRRRALRAVTVPELLAADPPSRAQLEAGRRGCGPS